MTIAADHPAAPGFDVTQRIRLIRGHRVLIDSDLAALYGVSTKRLNEQVRRNIGRFPADFVFPLSDQEVASLRSQSATLRTGRGAHRKCAPLVFTEHGAIRWNVPLPHSTPARATNSCGSTKPSFG
jgi:hypothetical protein